MTTTVPEQMWAVTTGIYSDYRVKCVCPTKRDAEAVAAKMRGVQGSWHTDATVEEMPVALADVEQIAILRLSEVVWDDGTTGEYRDQISYEWPFDAMFDDAVPVQWRWVRAPVHKGKGGRLEVSGTDHERVRKVFGERKALLRTDDAARAKREARGR